MSVVATVRSIDAWVSGALQQAASEPLLRVENVSCSPNLAGVTFDVRPGEVVAVTGGLGSGRRELSRCLAGALRPDSGEVVVSGQSLKNPFHAVRRGVVYLPDDRKREALMLDLSIVDNVALGSFARRRGAISRPSARQRLANQMMRRLGIKAPTPSTAVRSLSGGNQQKVILGRWLSAAARIYVFDEPTTGIDVGAKLEIHKLLRQLVAEGAAIVVFSSDYDEIEAIADRVLVLRRGRIVGEFDRENMDKHASSPWRWGWRFDRSSASAKNLKSLGQTRTSSRAWHSRKCGPGWKRSAPGLQRKRAQSHAIPRQPSRAPAL